MNRNSAAYTFIFILVISIVFGAGVSIVHYATLDTLAKNEALNRNRVVCNAFLLPVESDMPEAFQKAIDTHIETKTLMAKGMSYTTLLRKNSANPDVGFVFSGMGFWDKIEGIIVLSADLSRVVNIQFLDQKETPGLGARIEEPWFTDQFKGLEIDWTDDEARRLIIGTSSDPSAGNRVDAITGASQTSLALEKLLNDELNRFHKVYRVYQSDKDDVDG
ncbi:MAG: FMN-binding protein [Fidelibacterota bacterium]